MGPFDDYVDAKEGLRAFIQTAMAQDQRKAFADGKPQHMPTRHQMLSYQHYTGVEDERKGAGAPDVESTASTPSVIDDMRGDHQFILFYAGSLG